MGEQWWVFRWFAPCNEFDTNCADGMIEWVGDMLPADFDRNSTHPAVPVHCRAANIEGADISWES